MSQPEGKNPEHRSNNALLCFCIGVGLMALAQFLGVGAVIGAALAGDNPALIAGGVGAVIAVVFAGAAGFVLAALGGVWMIARVIADQRGDASEKRYRDIER